VRGAESPFFDFLNLTSDSRENLFETPSRVGRYMLESVLPPFERAKMILQAVTPTARDPAAMQFDQPFGCAFQSSVDIYLGRIRFLSSSPLE